MKLARVIGTIWATRRIPHMEGATLQLIQPLDGELAEAGEPLAAADTVGAGPGELVLYTTSYEAVIPFVTRPGGPGLGTKVAIDASILGIVEQHERDARWSPESGPKGSGGATTGKCRKKAPGRRKGAK
jgi:ethanolamine utilization protein EutN